MIVVVACGQRKRQGVWPASQLYTSPYFASCRRWAEALVGPDRCFVLSSRYGLVPSATPIASYDMTQRDRSAVSTETLIDQARHYGIANEADVVVGGKAYVTRIRAVWPHARAPFSGLHLFRQRSLLRSSLGRLP